MDPLKPSDHSQLSTGAKKKTATVERPRDQEGESTQSKPLVDEAIFSLINSTKQSFPILPYGAQRRPGLVTYQNQKTGASAFIIEDVHGSRITHDILADVFGQVKGVKPEETLFVLEGVKPDKIKTFNRSNARHPNQICCAVANESGAGVINPIANTSQMSLINAYITEAGKQGFSRTEALAVSWVL